MCDLDRFSKIQSHMIIMRVRADDFNVQVILYNIQYHTYTYFRIHEED